VIFFAICCCVFVKPISYKVAKDKIGCVSWFNDFISQLFWESEPRPQKSVDKIDRMSSALHCCHVLQDWIHKQGDGKVQEDTS